MPRIHFIHIRERDEKNQIKSKGGMTVAYEWIDNDGQPTDEKASGVAYAVSQCNPKDVFCRKRGAQIAAGRLARPDRGITYNIAVEGTKVIEAIMRDLGIPYVQKAGA